MTMDSLTTAAVQTPMPSLQIIPRILTLMEMGLEITPLVIQEINSLTRTLNGKTSMVMAMETIRPLGRSNLIDVRVQKETRPRTDSDAQKRIEMDILIPHLVTLPTLKAKQTVTLTT